MANIPITWWLFRLTSNEHKAYDDIDTADFYAIIFQNITCLES